RSSSAFARSAFVAFSPRLGTRISSTMIVMAIANNPSLSAPIRSGPAPPRTRPRGARRSARGSDRRRSGFRRPARRYRTRSPPGPPSAEYASADRRRHNGPMTPEQRLLRDRVAAVPARLASAARAASPEPPAPGEWPPTDVVPHPLAGEGGGWPPRPRHPPAHDDP